MAIRLVAVDVDGTLVTADQRVLPRVQAAAQRALEHTRARRPWIIATIVMLSIGLLASSGLWWRSEQQRKSKACGQAAIEHL